MKVYKNNPDGFKEIRVKMLFIFIPLLLIMLIAGSWAGFIDVDANEISPSSFVSAILFVVIFAFTFTRNLAKQRKIFKSYLLMIDDEVIVREQEMMPTISLRKDTIKEIVKCKNGNILIKGQTRQDVIIVSNNIANREALESDLHALMEVKVQAGKSILEKMALFIAPALLGLMAAIIVSTNKYLVLISAVIVTITFGWTLYEIQINKNIDVKTRRSSWAMIIVILVIIAIAYSKVLN
ncbi:hypothetical protein ACFQ21_01860 [Ohtaekwangia kribbensis]|jgi:hypothetical protein|uniref:PH domain-containing protein n=1 Tax=Ohtaekwangia kribbensis TaxID=688913 RepID=A0ABW3JW17_9BACT